MYNVCIVDVDKDLASIFLCHNKLNGKVNGFFVENINSTKLSNALRWYVFNHIYPSTNASLLKSSTKERILFKSFDLDWLNYPDESTTIRTVNKDGSEDVAEETFKEHYEQQINDIKAKNDFIERETAKNIHKDGQKQIV